MKHKISFITEKAQQNDGIFNYSANNPINRDDGVFPFHLLKQSLVAADIIIGTQDIIQPEDADILIFFDYPDNFEKYPQNKKKFLIVTECELIKPENWKPQHHNQFNKIFTWNDNFIDNKKYFKLNFSNKISTTNPENEKRKSFCCLIAGNKSVSHPNELYSKRVETIRWFEKNAASDFDLFGIGWDLYQFRGPLLIRALNRVQFLRKLLAPQYSSYKGRVQSKLKTLSEYQFSICFENAQNIPGYITEKVFDAFFAGCIPVYWGAPNVTDWIPSDCFIDFRKFKNYEELYSFMKSLSIEEITNYQKNILNYLNSEKVKPYTAEYFAKTLTTEIIKTLSEKSVQT